MEARRINPSGQSLSMQLGYRLFAFGCTLPVQNIFAIERMSMDGHPPSWLAWFAVALPVAIVSECPQHLAA